VNKISLASIPFNNFSILFLVWFQFSVLEYSSDFIVNLIQLRFGVDYRLIFSHKGFMTEQVAGFGINPMNKDT
jgi:hypothetical protein